MYCPSCGNEISVELKYCNRCGANLATVPENYAAPVGKPVRLALPTIISAWTGTTVITFLLLFIVQNTQNRDTEAIQLKLDELIVALKEARNETLDVEDLDEQELESKHQEMVNLADEAKQKLDTIKNTKDEASQEK